MSEVHMRARPDDPAAGPHVAQEGRAEDPAPDPAPTPSPLPAPAASPTAPDIASMVASRICHDLVSPLGAIANGMELLALTGLGRSPEADLIAQSVESANARVRFFRVALGAAAADQSLGASEVRSILAALSRSGRVRFEWRSPGDPPRREARAVFLLLMCLERAMAHGGAVAVARDGDAWVVSAESARLRIEDELWQPLAEGRAPPSSAAATVQFALLPGALRELGRTLAVALEPGRIVARL